MQSCNRGICTVFLLVGVFVGCAVDPGSGPALSVRDVGLQSALVPPLGDGVPPIAGIGGDGDAIVTRVGGWSGGPGAVQWHGGQWVVPYSARPGATLLNASCDVTPRPDATTLVELVSSSGQVLGSTAIPATTANVVIRAWILTSHTVVDGEQVVMRLSPRDAATGAWTSAAQDMTAISCDVNASGALANSAASSVDRSWSIVPGAVDIQQGTAICAAGNNTLLSANGSFWIPVPGLQGGESITSLALYFQGDSIPNVAGISLWMSDPQGNGNVTQVTGVSFSNTTGTGARGGAWVKSSMTGTPSIALTPSGVSQFFLFVQTGAGGTTSITTGSYTAIRS